MERDDRKHNIEDTISLEEIAEIVEMYIQEDEDVPVYDGYDISIDKANRENISGDGGVEPKKKVTKKKKNSGTGSQRVIKEVEDKDTKVDNGREVKKNNNLNNKVSYRSSLDHLKRRYRSVDMLIGISIIAIILSSGIGISNELPKFLTLSSWNGISFGDLGVPILVLSLCFMVPTEVEFDLKNKSDFKKISIKKLEIGLGIFLIGVIFNLMFSGFSANFRIMGILQFIGIVYMLVSLIYIVFKRFKFKQNVIGIILLIIGVIGTVGYFMVSKKFGYDMKNCLACFVDTKVLSGNFSGFERFGIISTLSAVFAGLFAAAGGSFMCDKRSSAKDKSIRLLIVGMALIIVSLILERKCPYNVNIWSPSFVVLVSGGFLIVLSCMLIIFDDMKIKELNLISSPFIIFGASPIFLLAINELLVNGLFKIQVYSVSLARNIQLDDWIIIDLMSEVFGKGSRSIAFVLIYLALCFALMLFMYGKRIFIRFK